MKKTIVASLFAALAIHLLGQNVLVNFAPNNQPYYGLTNYPQQSYFVPWSTNTAGWATNMTVGQYSAYVASYQVAFSNGVVISVNNAIANYLAWSNTYAQIPLGIADSSNRIANASAKLASFTSGTNTTASQTNAIVADLLGQQVYTWTYLNQMLGYLSRLGPGLQSIYNPSTDPVGH